MNNPKNSELIVTCDMDVEKFNCLCMLMSNQNKILQDINACLKEKNSRTNHHTSNSFYCICPDKEEWHIIQRDEKGKFLPPGSDYDEYEWVIVKRLGSEGHYELSVPRIAKYNRKLECWEEIDLEMEPITVTMWKPIPGTEWENVFVNNEKMLRGYRYD